VYRRFDNNGDNFITQEEFIELCTQLLWELPMTATQNFVEATANKLQRNKTYWNLVAKQIDTISRFFFPSLYLISMIILFSLDLSDDYSQDGAPDMFSGFDEVNVSITNWWVNLIFPSAIVALALCYIHWDHLKVDTLRHPLKISRSNSTPSLPVAPINGSSGSQGRVSIRQATYSAQQMELELSKIASCVAENGPAMATPKPTNCSIRIKSPDASQPHCAVSFAAGNCINACLSDYFVSTESSACASASSDREQPACVSAAMPVEPTATNENVAAAWRV